MPDEAIEKYLFTHEFFSGLEQPFAQFLSGCASELQIEKGRVLFQQGELANKFYLIRKGQISVQIPAIYGPPLEIQTLGNDQILGWSWLIAPYRWHFGAMAEEDSDLLEFDGQAILAHCEEEPRFGYELLKRFAALMSERLDAARQIMIDEWNPPGYA